MEWHGSDDPADPAHLDAPPGTWGQADMTIGRGSAKRARRGARFFPPQARLGNWLVSSACSVFSLCTAYMNIGLSVIRL